MNKEFSVATSVYKNDRPEFVREALDSMSFAAPQKREQLSAYTQIRDWFANKKRMKSN